jgi:hypothetical protein
MAASNALPDRNAEARDPAIGFTRPRGVFSLAFGLLAGPLMVLICEEVAYMSVPWACRTRATLPLHIVPAVTALITIIAGLIAWRDWHAAEPDWPDDAEGVLSRTRFIAVMGVAASLFSLLVIVGQWLAIFVLDPCYRT